MFLANFLNRDDMEPFTPLFEIICTIEIAFIMLTILSSCFVIFLLSKTAKLNRLVRLRMLFAILVACLYVVSRAAIMQHEFFGPLEYVETWALILGTIMKEVFLGYNTTLISILAFDRWVATKAWAWYESGIDSTLLFLALQEMILLSLSLTIAYLLLFEHITDMQTVYYFGVVIIIGTILFSLVYRRNLNEVREMKRGAVVNNYSLSRTFQIRENIAVLSAVTKLVRPLIIVCLPPIVFWPIFALVPPKIGYDGLRFFSVSMYELWLAIASFVVISFLPFIFPHMQQTLCNMELVKSKRQRSIKPISSIESNAVTIGDIYFSYLEQVLQKPGS